MFLFENSMIAHSQTIRGVQYITVSFYDGEKDVFQKVGELITSPLSSSDLTKVTSGSLARSGMALENE